MKLLVNLWKNYKSIPTTLRAGVRYSRANNKGVVRGLVLGAKKASKKVGPLPVISAGIGCACCPLPGTASVGFLAGSVVQEVGKRLYRLF